MRNLNILQKVSMTLMTGLVLLTFVGSNLHAILWQSSDWLVSTVLPATVVDLTNEERKDNTLIPLRRNTILDEAARLKAEHMAENGYFAHFSPKGVSPWHWFKEAGYTYAYAGENLAIHFNDSTEVVEAWMKSPTHRDNIVSGLYQEIGVGTAKGEYEGYETVFVVQLFGTPAQAESVVTRDVVTDSEEVETELAVADEPLAPVENETPTPTEEESTGTVLASQEPDTTTEEIDTADTKPSPEPIQEEAVVEPEVTEEEPIVATEVVEDEEETKSVVMSTDKDLNGLSFKTKLMTDASGLAPVEPSPLAIGSAGATMTSMATKPNDLLQITYMVLATAVVVLLSLSVVLEARKLHFQQVAYSLLLLAGMGGLWYAHSLLTTGAVIV